MNANETKYQYTGTTLGSFDFVGTKAEFEKMLSELQAVAPEFDGEIETGSTKSTLAGQKPGTWRDCLTYNGDDIAIAVGE